MTPPRVRAVTSPQSCAFNQSETVRSRRPRTARIVQSVNHGDFVSHSARRSPRPGASSDASIPSCSRPHPIRPARSSAGLASRSRSPASGRRAEQGGSTGRPERVSPSGRIVARSQSGASARSPVQSTHCTIRPRCWMNSSSDSAGRSGKGIGTPGPSLQAPPGHPERRDAHASQEG